MLASFLKTIDRVLDMNLSKECNYHGVRALENSIDSLNLFQCVYKAFTMMHDCFTLKNKSFSALGTYIVS